MPKNIPVKATFTAVDRFSSVVTKMQGRMGRMAGFAGRVGGVFKKFGSVLANVGGALMKVGRFGFDIFKKGALLATGAVIGIAYATQNLLTSMDELAKTTRAIGFPIEEFQEFRFAAEQSGVDADLFQSSLLKFTKSVGEAKSGYGALFTALKKTNPQLLKQLKGTDNMAEALDLYLASIKAVPDSAKKAAMATAGFGRSGVTMINLANASGEELEALRKQMRENGVVTEEQAKMAEDFNDTMNRVKLTAIGVFRDVVMPMIPEAMRLAEAARTWAVANRGLIQTKVREWAGKLKDMMVNKVIPAIRNLYEWFQKNWPEIKKVAGELFDFARGVAAFAVKLWDLRGAFIAVGVSVLAFKTAMLGVKLAETAAGFAAAGGAAAKAAPLIGGLSKALGAGGLVLAAGAAGVAVGTLINKLAEGRAQASMAKGNEAVQAQRGIGSASMSELNARIKKLNRAEKDVSSFGSYLSDMFTVGQDSQDARDEIRKARAAIQGEQMRRLSGALQAGAQAPALASPQVTSSETRTTNTERTELVIRDESGRAEITRGGKNGTVKLVPTGAMP
jgi:hypothetical protein